MGITLQTTHNNSKMKTFAIALIAVTTTAFTLNDLGSAANRLRLNVQNAVASAVARADALHDEFMENFWEMQEAIQDRFESITEAQYERAVEFSNMISESSSTIFSTDKIPLSLVLLNSWPQTLTISKKSSKMSQLLLIAITVWNAALNSLISLFLSVT